MDNEDYNKIAPKIRGSRDTFDRLYDYCETNGKFDKLRIKSTFSNHSIWTSISQETDHEKRAALICSLIGMLVFNKTYTAIGDNCTGYFFLPSMDSWGDWVKQELQANLEKYWIKKKSEKPIVIWKNGEEYILDPNNYNLTF